MELSKKVILAALVFGTASGQLLRNPYHVVENWAQAGRPLGSTSAVDIDAQGHIWVADRCGANSCANSPLNPILEFDASGKLLKSFGAGLLLQPHGIAIDKAGNIWVTDDQSGPGKGHQVFQFSPEGKVLMTLGKAGVAGNGPDTFNQPTDVAFGPNGDIFVADGHVEVKTRANGELYVQDGPGPNPNARISRFTKDGKFIKAWGVKGAGAGQLDGPHGLAFDSMGRLFIADRTNSRIVIYDQNGKFLEEWKQFSRPSGLFIDRNDTLYATDSESTDEPGYGYHPGWKRGIRIGSARTGKLTAFIPDPAPTGLTSGSEGVAADDQGNVYGAEVGARMILKYSRK